MVNLSFGVHLCTAKSCDVHAHPDLPLSLQVAVISIPSVRQKSREQLEKRQSEVQALKRRAAQPLPEADCKDASSSGEDTSDEAFLARHQPGWEEEHRRNYAPAAGALHLKQCRVISASL